MGFAEVEMGTKPSVDTPLAVSSTCEEGSFDNKSPGALSFVRIHAKSLLRSVERGGIERVTEEQRQQNPTRVWNACTFW
jgi:hypothetical protein